MNRITLLDGGMGQELIRRSGHTPTPLWSASVMLEQPRLVESLHVDFIQAGADVITINAYSCTPERLAQHASADLFEPLQIAACETALRARERCAATGVRVAGCLPPLVASYRPDLAPEESTSLESYRNMCALQARYVDLFLCETMGSISEALLACTAAIETGKPVWLAITLDDRHPECLRSGEPLSKAMAVFGELSLEAVLLNCSRPETISQSWKPFTEATRLPAGAYANGFTSIESLQPGGTVSSLEARNDLGPEAYADFVMDWVERGAAVVGGCCEVGPAHIACIRDRLAGNATAPH